MTLENENLPRHVMDYLREDMRLNPPRRVQNFDSLPQYRAARAEQARRNADTHNRWLRTWGKGLLWALIVSVLALLASHVAPIAAAHYAAPHVGNPY